MALSQGVTGGVPGVSLKAWALVTSAGVLVKGFNVSNVAKASTGTYTVTFSVAMSSTSYVSRFTPGAQGAGPMANGSMTAATTAAATCVTASQVSLFDAGGLWEFYE